MHIAPLVAPPGEPFRERFVRRERKHLHGAKPKPLAEKSPVDSLQWADRRSLTRSQGAEAPQDRTVGVFREEHQPLAGGAEGSFHPVLPGDQRAHPA